jgi:tetratricopeptide (TPR) repeat protein
MRKIILIITLAIISQVTLAQNSVYNTQPDLLFNQGKEMFLGGNWNGAVDMLQKFSKESRDKQLKEEADYMIAVSSFRKGNEHSDLIMKEFLEKHPETVHINHVNFLIASYYFDKDDWSKALLWFNLADLDYLKLHEQEDYSFRTGYTHLQLGNRDEATRYFGLLSLNSTQYRDAANFYLGYIDYSNGDYSSALQRFESLKNHPEYEEEIAFYTAQATFFEGRIDEAIKLADAFNYRYPHSSHTNELNRILGNSYYRLGQPTRAIPYYENYMNMAEKPLRGDAYFMGLSYFETAKYNEALKMFQQAVGEPDELSQNAQLQLGHTYLKLNQKQLAQMAFEAASRDNYNQQVRETAMFNYALLSHETNFSVFSESITLFENFIREFPNSQYRDQVNDILAETFLTTKDYRAALNAINRINNPGRRILEAKQMVFFQLGAQDFINGNMSDAIQNFNNSIAIGNLNPQARNSSFYWRGETYYRMGNYTNSTSDFRQFTQNATSADENWSLGWYNLGYSHFKQQQYGQAIEAFQRYTSAETNRNKAEYADALNRIGDSYYFNRNFNDAERYYSQAADVNPSAADYAAYQRAFVMGLQHNYQGKITALDNLMSKFPNSQYFDDALYEKSRALTMLNRENEAIAVLQRLLNDFPRSPLASQGGVQLGQLYYNTNNFQQSINAYKSVISNFPGSDDARNALVSMETVYRDMNDIQSYVDYANALPGGLRITTSKQDSLTYLAAESVYMRGNRTEAETAMTRYVQTYPNGAYSSDAHYYLGVISDEKNNKDQALSHFRRVIDAGNIKFLDNALIYTSQTEYQNGNYREALADYSRLANSARSATNKQLGQVGVVRTQSQLGNYHEASRAATELLANSNLSPETITEARYLRGKAYQQINESENAIEDFQFISNDTRSIYGAEAQFILADTFYKWKSYDRAEAQVKEFMQKGTPHQYWMARSMILLSDTYMAKGDEFQAKQYLESLKNNYKGDETDIQQMINERLR